MKICTICGTRPEMIRLSLIMRKLDNILGNDHIKIHTGQNFGSQMDDTFRQFFGLNFNYQISPFSKEGFYSFGTFMGSLFPRIEKILEQEAPDKVLVLGDTNSALSALVSERMGIPVYHMEAGNRCFDKSSPEELNRHLIDSVSSYNIPYTQRSKQNLIDEGIFSHKIYVSGNPIYEVVSKTLFEGNKPNEANYSIRMLNRIRAILESISYNITLKNNIDYVLVTFHRNENVSNFDNLSSIIEALNELSKTLPVICSIHPKTRDFINDYKFILNDNIYFCDPFSFEEFVYLEQDASLIITDSGTVSEEAGIFGIPCVIIRRTTERPELVEHGNAMVSGIGDFKKIVDCCNYMIKERENIIPIQDNVKEYGDLNVSNKIVKFLLGDL